MSAARLIEAKLPDFGVPLTRPELSRDIYARRFAALDKARARRGLDALLVYGDKEHTANLSYLTNFDPRFEEALLTIVPGKVPTLLAGPENLGRATDALIEVEALLYPPFGLMGQDRTKTPALAELLRYAGLAAGQNIGILGWKYFGATEADAWRGPSAFAPLAGITARPERCWICG